MFALALGVVWLPNGHRHASLLLCSCAPPADRRYLWGASQALLDSAREQATAAGAPAGGQGPGVADGLRSSGEEGAKVAVESAAFQQAYKTYVAQVPPETSVVSRLK